MSISIGNTNILYRQMADTVNTTNSLNTLEKTLSNGIDNATDKELLEACKSFETYFLEEVFKEMKETVSKSEEEQNEYDDYFGDMLYQEYAKSATLSGGIGLAQMLYESMKRD